MLKKLSPLFDDLSAEAGAPSIPPEQLLKARVLTALDSVRRERRFCEQLGYHLLWLWFLDRELSEGSFDHSVFAKNYERVLSADVARLFFAEVYDLSRQHGWTSDEPLTADGTLSASWASLKSFVRQDGADTTKVPSAKDQYPGNPTLNFRGEQRRNATHQSPTDPDSRIAKMKDGRTHLAYKAEHAVDLVSEAIVATTVTYADQSDPQSAPVTLAVAEVNLALAGHAAEIEETVLDKGYHDKRLLAGLSQLGIRTYIPERRQKSRTWTDKPQEYEPAFEPIGGGCAGTGASKPIVGAPSGASPPLRTSARPAVAVEPG